MRKRLGYVSAFLALGLLILIVISITVSTLLGNIILNDNQIHWFGQMAILFCIIATWAFWEI